uniref:Major facilitator superfamily (MFS) profile domain-containing protein n=1 Tax=Meloidogyne incognita TaxID=6306 RepID=A0A914MJB9_MELIC
MPNFATQISVDAQNRRLTNTSLTGIRTISTAPQQPTSATIVPTNIFLPKSGVDKLTVKNETHSNQTSKYGSVPAIKVNNVVTEQMLHQTIPEGEMESDESDDDEDKSSSSSSESSSYTRFSELTKKQLATIGMLAVANLCSTIAFSCIAPFYPTEAEFKGMNTSEIGLIFGIFELVMFITAPFLGKYMASVGSKRMFITGLLITGITAIGFGTLNLLPAGRIFFWSSLVIRCLEALGDACFVTSSFAISAKCFPGRIATIVGIMETFAGLGYTAGPIIGSVLYEYGGFQLPFFVLGVLLIFATAVSYFLIENIDDEPTEDAMGMLSMLRIPVIWLMVFAVIICAISLSFFDPTLAGHLAQQRLFQCFLLDLLLFLDIDKNLFLIGVSLAILGIAAGALYIPTFQNCLDAVKENGYDDSFQTYGCVSGVFQSAFAFGAFIGPTLGGLSVQTFGFPLTTTFIAGINLVFFNLSTIMVGFMFLLCGGFYCVTAPLWGFILDRWHCCNLLMLFGSTATTFSMLFVGPSPFLDIDKNLFLIGVSLAILGIAAGALYIPTFQNCLDAVKENGYDDSFQTYGCVSGVFQSAFAFGAFIGPTLGGLSVQTFGFPLTTTFIAGINLVFVCTLLIFFSVKRMSKRRASCSGVSSDRENNLNSL